MNISIHQATAADANDLLTTTNEALTFKLSRDDMAWETEPFTATDIAQAIARGTTYAVAVDGQPAGQVALTWHDEFNWGQKGLDNTAGYIHTLAIRDAFRGQNLGEHIVNWCYEQIRQNGRTKARLDCPAANQKLCGYYEKLGFTQVGVNDSGGALFERTV